MQANISLWTEAVGDEGKGVGYFIGLISQGGNTFTFNFGIGMEALCVFPVRIISQYEQHRIRKKKKGRDGNPTKWNLPFPTSWPETREVKAKEPYPIQY
ncbi:unnamed protein product [Allacma fusca]|uniref:Uncharacterized protein n=1 Tax=Allacma fusca TaxID=39272 RepID=A0A8J2KL73_9HEXA|nr:unnamed protein product [Allacma fusca]